MELFGSDAEEARDEALARVQRGNLAFVELAERVILEVAQQRRRFTSDDVWPLLPETDERRALGAVVRRLVLGGKIRPTGRWVTSQRVECHARPIREWEVCDEE
ncbi:MAG: hypothetical protein D6692_08555 [Planctomycetota bacterium]|nr:MAG: hypothetical protein D6692_08555 [Planctomycetota bacterium]